MSIQPSLLKWIFSGIDALFPKPTLPYVGVKAGWVKKYLYLLSLHENRAEKLGGGIGHHANMRISGGSRRFNICTYGISSSTGHKLATCLSFEQVDGSRDFVAHWLWGDLDVISGSSDGASFEFFEPAPP
jgi:hypothetical protein